MQSQQAPATKAAGNKEKEKEKEKRHGQRQSAGGTADPSAQGSSSAQPTDTHKRYHGHRSNERNRPAPQPHGDRGPGPSSSRSGSVRQRWDHQPDSRIQQRRDNRAQYGVGPKHGQRADGSVGPTNERKEERSGTGRRHASERPRGSAPRTEKSPEQGYRIQPGTSKDGLKHQQAQAVRRPSPTQYSDSGHRPYNSRKDGMGRRQDHRADSRMQQRRAHSPQHTAASRDGQKRDGSIRAKSPEPSGRGPRRSSEQRHGSAPRTARSPDQKHRVRPGTSKDGLDHQQVQAVRRPSPTQYSDSGHGPYNSRQDGMGQRQDHQAYSRMEQRRAYRTSPDTYKRYHWHRSDAGSRASPPQRSDRGPGPSHSRHDRMGQKEDHRSDRHREHRHADHTEHSAGPSQKPDGSVGSTQEKQASEGTAARRGTGRAPGSAPWPENMPRGRQPVWAVPGNDWLCLLPRTEEPMELGTPGDVEEPMEVDPPPPELSWDSRGASLLSTLQAHKERRRSARTAPYASSRRHHRKH